MKIGIEPINHQVDFHIFPATRSRTATLLRLHPNR